MKIDRIKFLAFATTLAAACGTAMAPSATPNSSPRASASAPSEAASSEPAAAAEPQPTPAGSEDDGDRPVAGEDACTRLVPAPCSESSSPRDACKSRARGLASDRGAAASQAFLACVRASTATLPAPDAPCDRARTHCDQLRNACDGPRDAVYQCHAQAGAACMDQGKMAAAVACGRKCMQEAKLDGCAPAQCAALAEKMQLCMQRCGNPAEEMEACQRKRCEAAQKGADGCQEKASQCNVPERCHTVDLPACQAGLAAVHKCLSAAGEP